MFIKINDLEQMEYFCQHVTNGDILDYYREGHYSCPMVINATVMICQNGDFAYYINSHDDFYHFDAESPDTVFSTIEDFVKAKNKMAPTAVKK